ncbi:MAG TPA: c-type cytochrome [Burkholderiaceae bacterium]|nr:c-type cytochrome [Burkholderiaceae bacterium]
MRRLAAALAVLVAQSCLAAPGNVDSMGQRMQACAACHGKDGRGDAEGYFPRIAGKPSGYLYNQLASFRDGRRHNATMEHLLAQTTDAYLREMADYFAALDAPHAPPPAQRASVSELERGRALVLRGDASRDVPACVECHGAALTGVQPGVPGLVGLPAGYVSAQLGAWRNGQRAANEPDCMGRIARQVSAQDIAAVAQWLAAQPLPADARPADASASPLLTHCGSMHK